MKHSELKLLFLVLTGLGGALCARATVYTESMFTTNTLFIEAEDADFGHGQFVTTNHIGMDGPYPGGSYKNLGTPADLDFDWHAEGPNGQPYRPNTGLSAGKEQGTAGNNRGTFAVTDWWTLGWNNEGDWENYTRAFPSAPQDYIVLVHVASGGAPIGIELDQITSGVGLDDAQQIKNPLGYFSPGRATASYDTLELFPLTDTNGNLVTVNLSGTSTLRATMLPGSNEDVDYFAFIPAAAPLFAATASTRDQIAATLVDLPTKPPISVDTTSISLTLDGLAVAGTPSKVNGITTVTIPVSPLLAKGSTHTLAAHVNDTNGNSYSLSTSFSVATIITHDTLFIEAEDADYGHGQFVTTANIGMNGPYPGGSYTNLGTLGDLDYDWHAEGPNGQVYRIATGLSAGKEFGSAGSDRGYFQVTDWWTLGWNAGGDWENYTRPFPAKDQWYEIYGHFASGGSPIGIRLDQVVSGTGLYTTNQVLKTLGFFAPGRATAGWDNLETFPLLTAPGGGPTVVQLNGTTTLRATLMPGSAEDMDYYAFVPVTVPPATITIIEQPQSAIVTEGSSTIFTVAATTTGQYGISYQWKKNGTAIPGAIAACYSTPALALSDDGAQFTVEVSSPGASTVTSQTAVVTVNKDTTPPQPSPPINVVTYHYDVARTGANLNESILTPANVNPSGFGKLFSHPVDGYVYAQPLLVSGLNISGKVHNVVFVATQHNSVYAFDADDNSGGNKGPLWQANLGPSVPSQDVGTQDVVPEIGITSTPVIDPNTGTLYVVAKTKELGNYFQRLHALNIASGAEQPGSPVLVEGAVDGIGEGSLNGKLAFNPLRHMNRPGLLLSGGIVYIAFASHGDNIPYHGWVFGYDAASLQQVSIFCTTPNASTDPSGYPIAGGGIWQAGGGPAADPQGNIYVETGNGTFDADPSLGGGIDYGDSFIKLSPGAGSLTVSDYFTPFNQDALNRADEDLGSSGPVVLPDSVGTPAHPHLLVGAGKEGKIYILDRGNMGKFNVGADAQVVQTLPSAIGGTWGSPAFFNGSIYYNGVGDSLKSFGLACLNPFASSQSSDILGFPGATPSISANGTRNGIAWTLDNSAFGFSGPAVLHAYDATDLTRQLYNSAMAGGRDTLGPAVKFTTPMVANGKVYVGAQYELDVLGLPTPSAPITLTPNGTLEPAGATHVVTAVVTDPFGFPRFGASVRFSVVDGPNAGLTSDVNGGCSTFGCQADFSGTVRWTYFSNGQPGVDHIEACTPDPQTGAPLCAQVANQWITPPQTTSYPDFSSSAGLSLVGSAQSVDTRLRLTPADVTQAGAAWLSLRQPVGDGFDTTFQFQISDLGFGGADGFAFVIQNASNSPAINGGAGALGFSGFAIGYAGIPESVAIEFDTWPNQEFGDPNDNHISIHTAADFPNSADESFSIGATTAIPDLSDGNVHTARIAYAPGTLQVYLDDLQNPVLTAPADIGALLNLDHGHAWVGFTAATGGAFENHDILNWSYTRTLREICNDGIDNDQNGLIDGADPACQVPHPFQISLGPSTGVSSTNEPYKVVARVTDANGNPQPGVFVRFQAEGPNFVSSGQKTGQNLGCFPSDCRTDQFGQVEWKYFGVNFGTDTIIASAYDPAVRLRLQAVATKTWQLPQPPGGNGDGLLGAYYDNIDFTALRLTRVDPIIAFDFGTNAPDPTISPGTFSIRWTGQVQPQFSETYTFLALTDDGVRLWIDGQLIIDSFFDRQFPLFQGGSIALIAQKKYDIRMDYYQKDGGAVAQLYWSSPSTPFQIVPQSQLHSSSPNATVPTSIGLKFGANEPPGVGSALAPSDTAGVVSQANWNNLFGNIGTSTNIISDSQGNPKVTSVTVSWSSPGTWSSTGRGEENNNFDGADRTLMTGYLDTTDSSLGQAKVTVGGLGPEFTTGGYDVIVYCLGGVGGRGGAYSIGSTTLFGTSAVFPSAQAQDPGVDLNDVGTYVKFTALHHSSFTLTANADSSVYPGLVNFRAPMNGIQILARPVFSFADCQAPTQTLLDGAARIADDGSGVNCVMHLTDTNRCATNGVWTILDPAGGQNVTQLHAHWRSLVGGDDGSVCTTTQFGRPGADGYSFNWGTDLARSFVGEEGTGTGVSVTVDTFDNGGGEAPGLEIKWRGQRIAFDPINPDQGLAKDFLRKNNFVNADLYVDPFGIAIFNYDGRLLFAKLDGWTGIAGGSFVFGARTGGASDNHWIDDVLIETQPEANSCPVASPVSVSVNRNGKVSFQLVANDPEGDALTFGIAKPPFHGSAVVDATTGGAIYTPDPGYSGQDAFVFTASDGPCAPATEVVSITVSNQCPIANSVSVTVPQDRQIQIPLPASDPDNDKLALSITQLPVHGLLAFPGPFGSVTYIPNSGYCGPDAFSYVAIDGFCTSVVATVSITVLDTEPPQIANLSVDKPVLWPRDRKMKDVTVNYSATDNCTAQPQCALTVTSNQPVSGPGNGNTSPDWQVIDAHHVRLRAEVTGSGTDRVYTITATCLDDAGNSSTGSVKVIVPHNLAGPKGK
jgi:hypothetical protein